MELTISRKQAVKLANILAHPNERFPSHEDILLAVGDGAEALAVNWILRFAGFGKQNVELAIQRAIDDSVISVGSDMKLVRA